MGSKPFPTADERLPAASSCSSLRLGGAKSGLGTGRGRSASTATASSAPALTSPRITASLTVAWSASSRTVPWRPSRSEEHTSELQSHRDLHSFPTRRSSDLDGNGFKRTGFDQPAHHRVADGRVVGELSHRALAAF